MDIERIEKEIDLLGFKFSQDADKDSYEASLGDLIISEIETIPDDHKFTVNIRIFAGCFAKIDGSFKEAATKICDDKSIDERNRFLVFYALYTMSRRRQNNRFIGQIIAKYKRDFSKWPLFNICLSMYYRFNGQDGSPVDLEKAVDYALLAIDDPKILKMEGIRLHFAETVCIAVDRGVKIDEKIQKRAEIELDDDILERGTYGKSYYIRAQLKAHKKRYHEALEDIAIAIELEDKNNQDAFLRIPEHIGFRYEVRQYISANDLDEKIAKLNARTENINSELMESRTKIIEYMTFFSGIIAFIVSTVQITLKAANFADIVGILCIMSSLLIVSFSSFFGHHAWASAKVDGIHCRGFFLRFPFHLRNIVWLRLYSC